LARWPETYTIYFSSQSAPWSEDPTRILRLQVAEGVYDVYTSTVKELNSRQCTLKELWQQFQRCFEADYRLEYNGAFQADIGYTLDAIVYTGKQSDKAHDVKPTSTELFKEQRRFA